MQQAFLDSLGKKVVRLLIIGGNIGPALRASYAEWQTSLGGRDPTPAEIQHALVAIYSKIISSGVDLGAVRVKNPLVVLNASKGSVTFETKPGSSPRACDNGLVFANAKIFTENDDQLADIQVPFRCDP